MKLGIAMNLPHSTPDEWARKHREAGLEAAVFPCSHTDSTAKIDSYVEAAAEQGLTIAEVGCWSNPNSPDPKKSAEARELCLRRLELADYVGARCCVNISGAFGEIWDGGYAENYSPEAYARIIDFTREIIDRVKPTRTSYALEPMPHMLPDSPESYLKLIRDIDRPAFAVHLDVVNMISSPQRYFENKAFTEHCFELLGEHIVSCHLKDCILTHALPVTIKETEFGDGGFDIPAYLAEIDRCSPELPVIIEHLSGTEKYLKAVAYAESCRHNIDLLK